MNLFTFRMWGTTGAWWGTWEVLGLMGKKGSELRCSELSQGWTVLNKDLLLPALIVG